MVIDLQTNKPPTTYPNTMQAIYVDIYFVYTLYNVYLYVKTYCMYPIIYVIIMIDVGCLYNMLTLLTVIYVTNSMLSSCIVIHILLLCTVITYHSLRVYHAVYPSACWRNVNDECYAVARGEIEQQT